LLSTGWEGGLAEFPHQTNTGVCLSYLYLSFSSVVQYHDKSHWLRAIVEEHSRPDDIRAEVGFVEVNALEWHVILVRQQLQRAIDDDSSDSKRTGIFLLKINSVHNNTVTAYDTVVHFLRSSSGIIACGVGNLRTNFSVSRTFRSRLTGQHLSDASCNLETLTCL